MTRTGLRGLRAAVTVIIKLTPGHALEAKLALLRSTRTLRPMGLQLGQRNHFITHLTHTLHKRAVLKVSGLVTEIPEPLAAFGMVGAANL